MEKIDMGMYCGRLLYNITREGQNAIQSLAYELANQMPVEELYQILNTFRIKSKRTYLIKDTIDILLDED